jgi:hypothetical protein
LSLFVPKIAEKSSGGPSFLARIVERIVVDIDLPGQLDDELVELAV